MSHSLVKRLTFLTVSGITLLLLGLLMPLTSYAHSAASSKDGYRPYGPRIEIGDPAFLIKIAPPMDGIAKDAVEKRVFKVLVVKIFYKCFSPKESYSAAEDSNNDENSSYKSKKAFAIIFVKQVFKFKHYWKTVSGAKVIRNLRCDGKIHLALVVVQPFEKFKKSFHEGKAYVKALIVDSSRQKDFDREKVRVIKARLVI